MGNSRTKNSITNMMSNFIYYFANIVAGMVGRKVLLMTLGIEYQGITGLFTNILSMLNIAELGIGTAIVYHLYKPLKEDDQRLISSLMAFYRRCYTVIALVVASVGGILTFFLDFFIGENSLPLNMEIIYLMMLAEVIISYSFTYKRSILYADQKNYCVTNADTLYIIGSTILTVIVLFTTKNYYLYLAVKIIARLVENICINVYVNRKYKFITGAKADKLDRFILNDIILKVKGLLFHKVGAYVVTGTSNILISKFVGLAAVGMYSNYAMIVSAVEGLFGKIIDSTVASVGNLLVDQDAQKSKKLFSEMQILNLGITNFTTTCLYCLLTPFISFYFGTDFTLANSIVAVIVLNFMLNNLRKVYGVFKTAAGIQYEDRYVPLIEAAVNLCTALIMIDKFGFVGVFLGTSVSNVVIYSYTFPILIYKGLLKGSLIDYCLDLFRNLATVLFSVIVSSTLLNLLIIDNLFINVLIRGIGCVVIPNALFWVLYHKNPHFGLLKNRVLGMLKLKR